MDLKARDPSNVDVLAVEAKDKNFISFSFYPGRPQFRFFDFETTIPASRGISGFNIRIVDGSNTVTADNGGSGFPFPDTIFPLNNVGTTCRWSYRPDPNVASWIHQTRVGIVVRDDAGFEKVQLRNTEPVWTGDIPAPQIKYVTSDPGATIKLEGTGYTLHIAMHQTPTDHRNPLKLSFDVIGVKGDGTTVENRFYIHDDLPPCY